MDISSEPIAQKTGSWDQNHMTPNQPNKDKNLIPARNSRIPNALNLITYNVHKYQFGGHFDGVIIRSRRRTQMGEMVQIVTCAPKFILI